MPHLCPSNCGLPHLNLIFKKVGTGRLYFRTLACIARWEASQCPTG